MKTVHDFLISPVNKKRYNNVKKVGDKELIINTEISNHQYINREAIVEAIPTSYETPIKVGDTILVHHNIFRRWHNVKGVEKNSRSWYKDNLYFAELNQIYLYKRNNEWHTLDGYCFVKPLVNQNVLDTDKEDPLKGIVKYTDGTVEKNQIIGFKPYSQFEFVVDGERLYRVLSNFITIKYEYQGNEEEYNPSWAQGG
tara:strand:+ start:4193 stop:4786 length:594 start_codon:yes stop_codon:yes gene_type:complete